MSESPEERSARIIAEAEALVHQAQQSLEKTESFYREHGLSQEALDKAVAQLSPEDYEYVQRSAKELLANDLAQSSGGTPAPAANKPKKPRNLI